MVRFVAAMAIAYLYYAEIVTGVTGIILLIAGAVLFITAIAGVCPLYSLLGISTLRKKGPQS